jgi:hypothetical protein
MALDAQHRSAPKLLRPLRGDVDKEKPAGDERRRVRRRRVIECICVGGVVVNHGD